MSSGVVIATFPRRPGRAAGKGGASASDRFWADLLREADGPLVARWSFVLRELPWFARFVANGRAFIDYDEPIARVPSHRALALFHGEIARPWTMDELSREVGLSRSALADRFQRLLGYLRRAPFQSLTEAFETATARASAVTVARSPACARRPTWCRPWPHRPRPTASRPTPSRANAVRVANAVSVSRSLAIPNRSVNFTLWLQEMQGTGVSPRI